MDAKQVDALAKLVGSGQSRRRILKTLAGGALASVAAAIGLGEAYAASRCRTQGVVCSKNADCCSAVCLPRDRTGRQVCAECATVKDCPAGDQCHTAGCVAGACTLTTNVGTACDDGNASTCNDVCTNGTCAGTPVDLTTDLQNCGACGNACTGAGQTCGIAVSPSNTIVTGCCVASGQQVPGVCGDLSAELKCCGTDDGGGIFEFSCDPKSNTCTSGAGAGSSSVSSAAKGTSSSTRIVRAP